MKKISLFFASIAPAFFMVGYNIGTGSITTMASSGASYGMSLTWPLLLSCIFTCILILYFGRYTILTGNTILHSFRSNFGSPVTLVVLVSLLFSEWVSSMGVMGVVTQVVQEWSRPLTSSGSGFSPVILALFFGAILYYIFWKGNHKFFEKILTVFVSVMALCFFLTMFMVVPDPGEIIKGLVPSIPKSSNTLLLIAGMVGTTMAGVLYVVRSILVQEKGWKIGDLRLEKRDAIVAGTIMFLLSISIMAAAAGTLNPKGLKVNNAIDMVNLLEPIAGRFAISIFVAGIVCAGLSSLFPIILLAPWLLADYNHKPRNMKSTSSRLLVLVGVSAGLVIPIFGGSPVLIMIVSQALAIVSTPLVLMLFLILVNKKSVMGEHVASPVQNAVMIGITFFTIGMAIAGISGISGL